MKKFLFLYVGVDESPDARTKWSLWFAAVSDSLVDSGNPLGEGRLVTAAGSSALAGDFTGCSLVTAVDMADAQRISSTCPAAGGIQIYEALPM